ncbi:hypothetical protein B0H17DRAFT_1062404, partial [Mycena rosella]
MPFDPATTVARVKELVWSAWPSGTSSPSLQPLLASLLRSSALLLRSRSKLWPA